MSGHLLTIALVGTPNVGKSTLFNRLTRTRQAIVADMPGVTRDRHYALAQVDPEGPSYCLIDTAGFVDDAQGFQAQLNDQAQCAIDEADLIFFLTDAQAGCTPQDKYVAQLLRHSEKPVVLCVNKSEHDATTSLAADFYQLGFEHVVSLSALRGFGMDKLEQSWIAPRLKQAQPEEDDTSNLVRIAILGRPNAGKSTLTNTLLGEERQLVSDVAGTTRDSIEIPFDYRGHEYCLIDTAGLRRKSKTRMGIERYAALRTVQALESAHVAILLLDAQRGISEQDLKLLQLTVQSGKALVIGLNKWDALTEEEKKACQLELDRRLDFIDYAQILTLSALKGQRVGQLIKAAYSAYLSTTKPLKTSQLTPLLHRAQDEHQPPMVRGRRIKLRFAAPKRSCPPTVMITGKQAEALPGSYKKYLEKFFRTHLKLQGTPIRLIFKNDHNPYA